MSIFFIVLFNNIVSSDFSFGREAQEQIRIPFFDFCPHSVCLNDSGQTDRRTHFQEDYFIDIHTDHTLSLNGIWLISANLPGGQKRGKRQTHKKRFDSLREEEFVSKKVLLLLFYLKSTV